MDLNIRAFLLVWVLHRFIAGLCVCFSAMAVYLLLLLMAVSEVEATFRPRQLSPCRVVSDSSPAGPLTQLDLGISMCVCVRVCVQV